MRFSCHHHCGFLHSFHSPMAEAKHVADQSQPKSTDFYATKRKSRFGIGILARVQPVKQLDAAQRSSTSGCTGFICALKAQTNSNHFPYHICGSAAKNAVNISTKKLQPVSTVCQFFVCAFIMPTNTNERGERARAHRSITCWTHFRPCVRLVASKRRATMDNVLRLHG